MADDDALRLHRGFGQMCGGALLSVFRDCEVDRGNKFEALESGAATQVFRRLPCVCPRLTQACLCGSPKLVFVVADSTNIQGVTSKTKFTSFTMLQLEAFQRVQVATKERGNQKEFSQHNR